MKLSILMPAGGAIAECEWRSRAFAWVTHRYEMLLPEAELVFGVSNSEPYNRAEARNDAFDKSTGDMLLVADADTVVNPGQIFKGIQRIRELGAPWVLPYTTYYNLTDRASAYIVEEPANELIPIPEDPGVWIHSIEDSPAGLQLLPREAWTEVGGWHTAWQGWGGEDDAWRIALDTLWGPHVRVAGAALHLWHPLGEGVNAADFSNPGWSQNRMLLEQYRKAAGDPERVRQLQDNIHAE